MARSADHGGVMFDASVMVSRLLERDGARKGCL